MAKTHVQPLRGGFWRDLTPALVCTALVFMVLPFIELMQSGAVDEVTLYRVESIRLPPPASPPPPTPPAEEPVDQPVETEEELFFEDAIEPMQIETQLDVPAWQPDFSFDGTVGYRVTTAPVQEMLGVYGLDDLDEAPQPLVRTPPVYPHRARLRGIEGVVMIEFVVRNDGTPGDIRVIEAYPHGWFEDAARRAVQRWRFRPGMRDGAPVPTRLRQQIRFELDNIQ